MDANRIIRIFEDRQQKVSLSEQEKMDVLSMKALVGENNVILQTDGKLLIKHYVGFIQINKTRLLIYPKIASKSFSKDEFKKSFDILMKLLSYSNFKSIIRTPAPQTLDKYDGDLLELFIGLFADEIILQFKRNINRGYNNRLENQTFIKGKIDFNETIKKNSFRRHLHYVNYDQFSEDILLNRIFKSVIQKLITRTRIKNNKLKLKKSLLWLEDVEFIRLDNEIWNQVQFTRQNSKYEPAFNLAKLFYHNSSPNLNIGDEYTFSFLIPVNKLFEMYLYNVLKMNLNNKLMVKYQEPSYYLASAHDKKYLKLRPDITFLHDNKVTFVIDAKYKEIVLEDGHAQFIQSDVYQMLAYSIRYRCNNISLIYPMFLNDKKEDFLVSELKINNYDEMISIKILKVDLELEPEVLANKLVRVLGSNEIDSNKSPLS